MKIASIILFLALSVSCLGQSKATTDSSTVEILKTKTSSLIRKFVILSDIINDSTKPEPVRDQAIEQAETLFEKDSEVESKNRNGRIQRYPVREYLTRSKFLPTGLYKINSIDVSYFLMSNYTINNQRYGERWSTQHFVNKDGVFTPQPSEFFNHSEFKPVKVKFETYTGKTNADSLKKWEVLLQSIGVSHSDSTKSKK